MKNSIRVFFLTLAIFACCALVQAELFQTIRINILSEERVAVEGEVVTIDAITQAVLKNVHGNDRIRVTIIAHIGTRKVIMKKVMDSCRKAGATSFELSAKT